MFYEIWELGLENYKKQRIKNEYIKNNREKFKLENKLMRLKFNLKHGHISKKEYPLLNHVLKKNSINQLNQEYNICKNNFYMYYLLHHDNFFEVKKVTNHVYYIYLSWECYNIRKQIYDGFKLNIKFKFYQKHDYPYDFTNNIIRVIKSNDVFVNTMVKGYIYNRLMKLWNHN